MSPFPAFDRSTGGKIRNASPLDRSELARLIAACPRSAAPRGADPIGALLRQGHLLVLDVGNGELGAAVHVELAGDRATIDLMVADPALAGSALEHRMSGVAHAYCEAYGCGRVDVVVA